ncbi:hypothetical protein [uncultured Clostridium sp.]|uniref:hypothetical protein n=2 Tax=Clostridium TaxID=1485 RepID=UPI0025DE157E|nr:hypothetical protein [uncultured Clostridium sp.]
MKSKISRGILSFFDLFLAIGAIYYGIQMIAGIWDRNWGVFPPEWIGRVPFTSWFWPGVIALIFFGIGNLFAAYSSISKDNKPWLPSLFIGIVFLVSLIISVPVLGEMYLPTVMFIILSLVQLILAMLAFFYLKERSK